MKIVCEYCNNEIILTAKLDSPEDNVFTAICDCRATSLDEEYERGFRDGEEDSSGDNCYGCEEKC